VYGGTKVGVGEGERGREYEGEKGRRECSFKSPLERGFRGV